MRIQLAFYLVLMNLWSIERRPAENVVQECRIVQFVVDE